MSNVIPFPAPTLSDIPPAKVLEGAIKADLEIVIVIGRTKDGRPYCASSTADDGAMMLLVERFKQELL